MGTLELGDVRAHDDGTVVTLRDVAVSSDATGTRRVALADLLDVLVPGMAITPAHAQVDHVSVAADRLSFTVTTAAATTLRYAHAVVTGIPPGATMTVEVRDGDAAQPGVPAALRGTVSLAAPAELTARTDLAWLDGGGRSLAVQPPASDATGAPPPLSWTATTATLLHLDPSGDVAPHVLPGTLPPVLADGDGTARPLALLRGERPRQQLDVRVGAVGTAGGTANVELVFGVANEQLGDDALLLAATCPLDATRLSVVVDHDAGGIALRPAAGDTELTWHADGLTWRATNADGPLFLLATTGTPRIVRAPGTQVEVALDGVGDVPLRFAVERFAITAAGLEADAVVVDDAVVLHGLDTAFRFVEGVLQVRPDGIEDVSLAGTGPLPTGLLGDATADIVVRLRASGGALVPVATGARLTDDTPLYSPDVLFRYAVDGLGLDVVTLPGPTGPTHHFWFTLTGRAGFAPPASFPQDHVLADLTAATIDVVALPVVGDASAIADQLPLRVDLPDATSFALFGCFDMRITSVAILPAVAAFDGAAGLELVGQVSFADGVGDRALGIDSEHTVVLGAPAPGESLPRVHVAELAVGIEKGDAFELDVAVTFRDDDEVQGFTGQGRLQVKGLPSLAVAAGFVRVRREADGAWLRAWFLAADVDGLTLRIPAVNIYLRSVGLGFGYRYTLTSIAALDEAEDLASMIATLRELSRSQGELATVDAWDVALEPVGDDPRWTIALNAMFSQNAAPTSTPIRLDRPRERQTPSAFLFDVTAAVRSDLTFFLAVRGWLNTTYLEHLEDTDGDVVRTRPLFSGFAVLEPRRQRFLAQLSTNPDGHLGARPPLPDFLAGALRASSVAATVLVEPDLLHAELGWPNQLRWRMAAGPLQAEVRAGLLFRLAQRVVAGRRSVDIVLGISVQARASLRFSAGVDIGIAGVNLTASADATFGARLIAAARADSSTASLDVYGTVGLDVRLRLEVTVWVDLLLVTKRWRMTQYLQFSASVELGIAARANTTVLGVVGQGTLRIRAAGRSFEVDARIAHNPHHVASARAATRRYMAMGLEAGGEDVEVPGATARPAPQQLPPTTVAGDVARGTDTAPPPEAAPPAPAGTPRPGGATPDGPAASRLRLTDGPLGASSTAPAPDPPLDDDREDQPVATAAVGTPTTAPGYLALRVDHGDATYLALYPSQDTAGFVPVPPAPGTTAALDFRLVGDVPDHVARWDPTTEDFVPAGAGWRARWDAVLEADAADGRDLTLAQWVDAAFVRGDDGARLDPLPLQVDGRLVDERVGRPDPSAYEAAVRGAIEQFRSSPLFRPDPATDHQRALWAALHPDTSIYGVAGRAAAADAGLRGARQLRGLLVEELLEDVREHAALLATDAAAAAALRRRSPAFLLGLVLRVDPTAPWLDDPHAATGFGLAQRVGAAAPDAATSDVRVFNPRDRAFASNPPRLDGLRTWTDAATIAFSWDLAWDVGDDATDVVDDPADDPEHHLAHYEVTRRSLADDDGRRTTTTVRPADVLAADDRPGWAVTALRPRFQYVDHFGDESSQEVVDAAGRSYLYTIVPVDLGGTRGRAVTVVATRRATDPPPVPSDATLAVDYRLAPDDVAPGAGDGPLLPHRVAVDWTEPGVDPSAPVVAVAARELVLRRERAVPVGSYGLDATTARDDGAGGGAGAAVRPGDVVVPLDEPDVDPTDRTGRRRVARIDPGGLPGLRPDDADDPSVGSWAVFVRTVSRHGVPSALAPVELRLRFAPAGADGTTPVGCEERRPPRLEWVRPPSHLDLLPARDGVATAMTTHVPMCLGGDAAMTYEPHPSGTRGVALTWNQAASTSTGRSRHPVAGYHLFRAEVDPVAPADGHAPAAPPPYEHVAEVRLQPRDEVGLVPDTTHDTAGWEAWYPTTTDATAAPPDWQGHHLRWPTGAADVPGLLHPQLQAMLDAVPAAYDVTAQVGRPLRSDGDRRAVPPGQDALDAFLLATAPARDPYGWAVLQHLGLSVALRLRRAGTRAPVLGDELLRLLQTVLPSSPHLVVELLVRPEHGTAAAPGDLAADALLGLVQVSLRPLAVRTEATDDASAEDVAAAAWADMATDLLALARRSLPDAVHAGLAAALVDEPERLRTWSARFLRHGVPDSVHGGVAVARPLPGAPALTVPDASGRVHHADVLRDRWAHALRYAVRPYGRYDRLWSALAASPLLADVLAATVDRATTPPSVDPDAAGIDVRVDRTEPVPPPVVVSSRRLDDTTSEPGEVRPGHTWEVAFARHPEQALSERNATLARRLDHRQLAVTLLRRFDLDRATTGLGDTAPTWQPVPATEPTPLLGPPPALEHRTGEGGDDTGLAVADRLGGFAVGGLAVQLDHLPFYYTHRLVAVAQTSTDVSEPVHVDLTAAGYRSPPPEARLAAHATGDGTVRREVVVPLARLWDALTPAQQARWPGDRPTDGASALPGALPDPDVAYELVHRRHGTATVVARVALVAPDDDPSAVRWTAMPVSPLFDVPAAGQQVRHDVRADRAWRVAFELRPAGPVHTAPVPVSRLAVAPGSPLQDEELHPALGGVVELVDGDGASWLAARWDDASDDDLATTDALLDHPDVLPVVRAAVREVAGRPRDAVAGSTAVAFDPVRPVPSLPWLRADVQPGDDGPDLLVALWVDRRDDTPASDDEAASVDDDTASVDDDTASLDDDTASRDPGAPDPATGDTSPVGGWHRPRAGASTTIDQLLSAREAVALATALDVDVPWAPLRAAAAGLAGGGTAALPVPDLFDVLAAATSPQQWELDDGALRWLPRGDVTAAAVEGRMVALAEAVAGDPVWEDAVADVVRRVLSRDWVVEASGTDPAPGPDPDDPDAPATLAAALGDLAQHVLDGPRETLRWAGDRDAAAVAALRARARAAPRFAATIDALADDLERVLAPLSIDPDLVRPRDLRALAPLLGDATATPRGDDDGTPLLTVGPLSVQAPDADDTSWLVWQGARPDAARTQALLDALDGPVAVGDAPFTTSLRALLALLGPGSTADGDAVASRVAVVAPPVHVLDEPVPVAPVLPDALAARVVVTRRGLRARAMLTDEQRDLLAARLVGADRRAVAALHARALVGDLGGGRLEVRARRRTAAVATARVTTSADPRPAAGDGDGDTTDGARDG